MEFNKIPMLIMFFFLLAVCTAFFGSSVYFAYIKPIKEPPPHYLALAGAIAGAGAACIAHDFWIRQDNNKSKTKEINE